MPEVKMLQTLVAITAILLEKTLKNAYLDAFCMILSCNLVLPGICGCGAALL